MKTANFEAALALTMEFEGGFSDHAMDPGGQTRYGITKAVAQEAGYTGLMKDFPKEMAKTIYKKSYWDATFCPQMPHALAMVVFDCAVNSGNSRSVKILQATVNKVIYSKLAVDGRIGPQTLGVIRTFSDFAARRVAVECVLARFKFISGLGTFNTFGNGWSNRLIKLAYYAGANS